MYSSEFNATCYRITTFYGCLKEKIQRKCICQIELDKDRRKEFYFWTLNIYKRHKWCKWKSCIFIDQCTRDTLALFSSSLRMFCLLLFPSLVYCWCLCSFCFVWNFTFHRRHRRKPDRTTLGYKCDFKVQILHIA